MKRKKRNRKGRRLQIQKLEDRKLLAADLGLVGLPSPLVDAAESSPPIELLQSNQQGQSDNNQRRERRIAEPHVHHSDSIEARSIDGTGNNLEDPTLGSAEIELNRATTVEYADGISEPAGENRPSAREISNTVSAQETTEVNDRGLTDLTWLFGQFIDHDIDLTEPSEGAESFDIEVPIGDIYFDPFGTGEETISLTRSNYDADTGTSVDNPLQQVNEITAFLDGSVIYGSDEARAAELRTFEGGLLNTSEGDLLPFNTTGLSNAGGTGDTLFLAGDIRANENIALTAMHTVWVREHNHWAQQIAEEDPSLSDEEIYQAAKAIVTAELQAITYNEYLPALLGEGALSTYAGYDSSVDPGINNVFSSAAYRFGHSMLSSELLRLNDDGTVADEGNIALQDAFFSPDEISANGIDSILMGALTQVANEIDTQVVDDIRNFLFGPPGAGGFDLASLNIQRGRDHGLADYNQVREDFGLERVTSFDEITSDADLADKLEQLYGTVDDIDVWVGGLAEDHVEGSSMGELFSTIIVDQFERIRSGDRLWYENTFSNSQIQSINQTSLADVIERNTGLTDLRDDLFFEESLAEENESPTREPRLPDLVDDDARRRTDNEPVDRTRARDVNPLHRLSNHADGDRTLAGAIDSDGDQQRNQAETNSGRTQNAGQKSTRANFANLDELFSNLDWSI